MTQVTKAPDDPHRGGASSGSTAEHTLQHVEDGAELAPTAPEASEKKDMYGVLFGEPVIQARTPLCERDSSIHHVRSSRAADDKVTISRSIAHIESRATKKPGHPPLH